MASRLLFLAAMHFFILTLLFKHASLHAQSVSSQSAPLKEFGKARDTGLTDMPSSSATELAQDQTEKNQQTGEGSGTQETRSQAAAQPNVIDPLSIGRFPGRIHPGPLAVGEKFAYFEKPMFGPRAIVMTAVGTGIFMANPSGSYGKYPHEWLDGAGAFGRNYGDKYARNEASAFGRFSFDSLLHIDPRYSRSRSKSFVGRSAHALGFTFVDKTDRGHSTIALGNFAGAVASGFVGNAYLPNGWNDPTHAGQRTLATLGGYGAQNLAQEFAPEIVRGLRRLHLPRLPLPPVWWTRSGSH